MKSLLSRLAFWWAAFAVGLCASLPLPQGKVARIAVLGPKVSR